MTRHDGENPAPEASNEPAEPPSTGSGATETTGTWAFVSPFAAAPGPYLAPTASNQPTPDGAAAAGRPTQFEPPVSGDRQESTAPPAAGPTARGQGPGQPAEPTAASGRPVWEQAGPAGWENTATGAVGGGAWMPGTPPGQQAGPPPTWGAPTASSEPPTWGAPALSDGTGKPPSRWKTWQKVTAGGVLAGVLAIGGVAAVSAASASSNSTTSQAGFAGGGPGFAGGENDRSGTGLRGGMAGAMALANALHGDFVVADGSGTQTMRLQTGELTAVASDSITVKSTDGYTATYAIGSGVDVSGLTQGATVRVVGTVAGDTATATSVTSGTAGSTGGVGGGQGQSGAGRGESGMQPPEGMTPPNGADQAPQTS